MPSRTEVEARLRGYAQEYDREFPSMTHVESRIMARTAITPRSLESISPSRPSWARTGGLVRELAIACVVLLLVGALVVGVAKLRALPRNNVPSVTVQGH